jgi:hypothetical protein
MKERFKIGKNLEVLSLARRQAAVKMVVPFGAAYVVGGAAGTPNAVISMALEQSSQEALSKISLQSEPGAQSIEQVLPKDSDYIYPLFRALSKAIIPGYWVDFSRDGVLEKAVPLFLGQTVYKNHGESVGIWGSRQFDVEKWLGSVSQAVWDPKGDKVGGVSGVNVEMKIDALMNPRIARGLLMKPPAIHSCSETVLFDYDYSHPELVEQERFWRMLGEEVEGEIVRFIVTEIVSLHELSLVFQGADQIAKQIPEDTDEGDGDDDYSDKRQGNHFGAPPIVRINDKTKEITMKLTEAQRQALKKLGLVVPEGEDIPEALALSLVDALAAKATSADAIVAASRAEVLRLATLAEGAGEGDARKLDPAIAGLIEKADSSQLPSLSTLYQEKAAKAFPLTCAHGHPATQGRSSVEKPEEATGLAADEEDTHLL